MDDSDTPHKSLTPSAEPSSTFGVARYRRLWTLFVFLLFSLSTWPIAHYVTQLQTDNAIESWLGDSDPAAQAYQEFSQEFHANESLVIAINNCLPGDPRLERLATQLEKHEAILQCMTDARLAEMTGEADFGEEGPAEASISIVGKKRDFSGIFAEVQIGSKTDRKALLRYIYKQSECAGFAETQVHLGGPTPVNVALDEAAEESLRRLMPVVIGVSLLFLFGALRDWRLVLMLIFCSLMTVLVTLALMSASGEKLNLIGIAIPPMLLVLSLSFGLHLIHHWRLAPHVETAASFAVSTTLRPTLLAAATTAVGCLSLVFSQFEPVRAFGIWAAVGTVVAVAISYLFVPVYLLGETPSLGHPPTSPLAGLLVRRLPTTSVIVVWGVVTLTACAGLRRLTCESDALNFLPPKAKLTQDYELIERRLTGLLSIEVILKTATSMPLVERVHLTRILAEELRKHPDVEEVFDFTQLFSEDVEETADLLDQFHDDPEFGPTLRTRLTDDQTGWRLTAHVASVAGPRLGTIVDELPHPVLANARVIYTGVVPLIIASQREIFAGLRRSLLAASAVLLVILSIAFQSPRIALLLVVLNISPVLIVFGLLGWLGHPINIASLTTATVALGVALDDTLHFVSYFREESLRQPSASNRRIASITAKYCFRPMMQTTLVAGLGLGTLALSSFVPIAEFGILLSTLLMVALLGDLILLPALLSTVLGRLANGAVAEKQH